MCSRPTRLPTNHDTYLSHRSPAPGTPRRSTTSPHPSTAPASWPTPARRTPRSLTTPYLVLFRPMIVNFQRCPHFTITHLHTHTHNVHCTAGRPRRDRLHLRGQHPRRGVPALRGRRRHHVRPALRPPEAQGRRRRRGGPARAQEAAVEGTAKAAGAGTGAGAGNWPAPGVADATAEAEAGRALKGV